MDIKLRKKVKNNFVKDFFGPMKSAVFGKTIENVRKYWNIKLVTTETRKTYLVPEPNYHTTTLFTENLLVIEMRKIQMLMNKRQQHDSNPQPLTP